MYADALFFADALEIVTISDDAGAAAQSLDRFLAGVERRALVMAEIASGDRDEALDIVQDSMLAFARRYAHKPEAQWAPLFHRVLQNRIRDWHRRRAVRNRLFGWLPPASDASVGGSTGTSLSGQAQPDPIQALADPNGRDPATLVAQGLAGETLVAAIAELPSRQQQAFLLRVWEGMDVAATAHAMGCSDGSVKTHLSRALGALRKRLQEHW